MKQLKVLVLSHTGDLLGGAERSMLDVFDYWVKHYRIEPVFVIREPVKGLAGAFKERNWRYYSLDYTFWSASHFPNNPQSIAHQFAQNSKAIINIEQIIQKENPAIVMTNSVVCPWAAIAAYYQRIPHVWFVREYGDLDHGRIFEIGQRKTLEDVGTLSELVVANSSTLSTHIQQFIPKNKTATLYNPFNIKSIIQKSKQDIANPYKSLQSLKLIITSNIARTKGQLEAVKAVGVVNQKGFDVELCLVGQEGDKETMAEIKNAIQTHGIANKVHLVGRQNNALAFVRHADVGITPSRMEAFGRVTFEYIAIGKPVIGANSGATPEMVQEGKNGYVYDPNSYMDLASKIELLMNKKKLLPKMSQSSRDIAEKMMSGEQNIDALFERVQKVLKEGKPKEGPLHYTHHWLEQAEKCYSAQKTTDNNSIRRIARTRVRHQAKRVYYKIRSIKGRVTGK